MLGHPRAPAKTKGSDFGVQGQRRAGASRVPWELSLSMRSGFLMNSNRDSIGECPWELPSPKNVKITLILEGTWRYRRQKKTLVLFCFRFKMFKNQWFYYKTSPTYGFGVWVCNTRRMNYEEPLQPSCLGNILLRFLQKQNCITYFCCLPAFFVCWPIILH